MSSLIHTSFTFWLSFCHSNIIRHYFCDILPLLALSCSDTHVNKILIFALGSLEVAVSLSTIFFSYLFILVTIVRIRLAEGRRKVFSTCTSHLTANVLLYGTLIFMYLCSSSSSALEKEPLVYMFYMTMTPMLKPLIYSLRNREVILFMIFCVIYLKAFFLVLVSMVDCALQIPVYFFLRSLSFTDNELVCTDIFMIEVYSVTATVIVLMLPFGVIIVSYLRILITILKMFYAEGYHKAFCTCLSHLTVILLFFGA
ncbi:olfactory receptor 1019-like, partial [Tachyglossus aculeatus]|uniref:olfactory receptor 1019-like n=1 Tax=Tachyglossus aculeatus TaxID=9261 RepID=UPI0018F3C215